MYNFWIALKLLTPNRRYFQLTTILSLLGLMLGVASLVVAMAVVSGYETTLRSSVVDVFGHVVAIRKYSDSPDGSSVTAQQISEAIKEVQASTPFVFLEGILAHNKKVGGILMQGLDLKGAKNVLNYEKHLHEGKFTLEPDGDMAGVLIGKGIAKTFNIKVGDVLKFVLPLRGEGNGEQFRPKLKKFIVRGVLALGRHDFDQRYVLVDLAAAQEFSEMGQQVTGYRFRLESPEQSDSVALMMQNLFGSNHFFRTWKDVNSNIFEAVRVEKRVLFFVLLIIIFAACFNVCSTLFLNVMQRYRDISVLKTLGATRRFVWQVFTFQGLIVGILGVVLGIGLGYLACFGFLFLQENYGVIPSEVYKLDKIEVDIRLLDLVFVVSATLIICFLASLIPAWRGAKLMPAEGLKYE